MKNKIHTFIFSLCGFFLLLDQILKHLVRTNPEKTFYILKPYLGWEYLENPGVAFGLPIPNILLVTITPIIIFILVKVLIDKKNLTNIFLLGWTLIITGAVSNYIDRILFAFTVDYFRIYTSVINLADITIVTGVLLSLYKKEIRVD